MTLSFASILPAYHWHKKKGIQPKNTTKRFSLKVPFSIFDSPLKAELAALTKGTNDLEKLFPIFLLPAFHIFYHLHEKRFSALRFVVGTAHSLSLSCFTLKTVDL